jgi:RNA polymerase sigma-32 factor
VRLVSYALHWIKAEIHEYILKNWRMVKVATTKAQRKLFFNLRSMKQRFKSEDAAADLATHRDTLSPAQVRAMADELHVDAHDVLEMETRLSGGDVMLDPMASDDGEEVYGPISYLTDSKHEPPGHDRSAPARCAGLGRHCQRARGARPAQPAHRGGALAQGQ